ncbi:MAG: DegT/DnrJ/EryC1/StrS aminotransferase family protein [Hyphomicrobiaceae bacterium]|nr:DegT/DnrJ/EryC1/StrS aminotransferase family protein [Hyphomicrobiaceae bacterium]
MQFIDLQAQRAFIGERMNKAISGVLEHGRYIMGPEVATFESQLAEFGEAEHAIGCGNGTDAILLPLMAWGIGAGDAVFCPSFTFAATAEMIAITGASPIFIDVLPDTFNMDPNHLETAIKQVESEGKLAPKAVIAVDIFGQIADYPAIKKLTDAHGLKLISDAAQAYGSTWGGKQAAAFADIVTTSFFPAKPLGCYGDGGAVLTNDLELADIIRSLRVHGKGTDKYDNVRIGVNSRLDTLQAAILIEKLSIFANEITKRNKIADRYNTELANVVTVPHVPDGVVSTWAQYTILSDDRDGLQKRLGEANVPSVVYYAKPLHLQTAYRDYPVGGNGLPVTEELQSKVLSLPMHPYMDEQTQDYIIKSIQNAVD